MSFHWAQSCLHEESVKTPFQVWEVLRFPATCPISFPKDCTPIFGFNRIWSLALLGGRWLPLALLRVGTCQPFMDMKKEIRKLHYARCIQQRWGIWVGRVTILSDKSHSRKGVFLYFQMFKKYCLLAVLVALGLWLSNIDTISSFVLANIVPRNQAERGFVTKLIYFSNSHHLPSALEMIKWHTVAILFFTEFGKGFLLDDVKREKVFISTCEIYLFPFT